MTALTFKSKAFLRSGGFAAAFAFTAACVVGAAPTAKTASASEFEQAFTPFELPEDAPILSPAELREAEALSASAPVEENAEEMIDSGDASYYGARFAGRRTASGEIFNPRRLTAAHRTLPFGSRVKVTNRRNGKSVVVRINDRGPFHKRRVIDLSRAAAQRIGLVHTGHGPVELALLD